MSIWTRREPTLVSCSWFACLTLVFWTTDSTEIVGILEKQARPFSLGQLAIDGAKIYSRRMWSMNCWNVESLAASMCLANVRLICQARPLIISQPACNSRTYVWTTNVFSSAALWRGPVNFHALGLLVSGLMSRSRRRLDTLSSGRWRSNRRLVE